MEPRFEPIYRRHASGNKWYVFDFDEDIFSPLFRPYPSKKACQLAIDRYTRHINKMNNENKIVAYINSKSIGGEPIRHELHQRKNWQGQDYYCLVDAYYNQSGKRLCENSRGLESYTDIESGLNALEYVSGKRLTKEFRAMLCNPNTPMNQILQGTAY